MVTNKLNLSMTEPRARQIYAKQGDTGRVLDITLDQTPEDGTLRILRPDGVEVTSEAVTGGEVESGSTFESLTEADVTELTVGIEPVQNLNGYDKPWVGGAGTNKYDDSAKTNALINEQGAETTNTAWYLSDYCAIPLGTTKVTLSWQSEMTYYQGRVVAYDSSKAFISGSYVAWTGTAQSHTFDVPSTASFVRVNYSHVVNSQESPRNNVRLNVGTSDLGYEPYSNICPITGHDEVTVTRTGENLLTAEPRTQPLTVQGVTVTPIDKWHFRLNGTCTTTTWLSLGASSYNITLAPSLPNGTYTVSCGSNKISVYVYADSDTSKTAIGNHLNSITVNSTIGAIRLLMASGQSFSNEDIYVQIVRGTTVPTWTPYQDSTYTTSLGQTVYGGTLDMVTGQLVVDKVTITFSTTQGWTISGSSGHRNFYYPLNAMERLLDYRGSMMCNEATIIESGREYLVSEEPVWVSGYKKADLFVGQNWLYFHCDGIEDITALGNLFSASPLQVVYQLAEPIETTLTPQQIKTLVGTNNVWASSGQIVNIKFTYGGLFSELPSDATSVVGKCYCDIEQNGVSSMPFTLNVKKNERES